MPKFSVIISVFNKEKHISSTIESVLNQSYTDFEVIILNDGSTDNSAVEILNFKDTRIHYFCTKNKGAGAGRNYAIKKATGDYIALLDADDIWDKDYLKTQNESIKQFKSQKIFSTAIRRKIQLRTIDCRYSIKKSNKIVVLDYFKSSMLESILHSSSTVLQKNIFEVTGYYNPNIKSGQDTDLYIRIGLHYKIVFNPKSFVIYNSTIKNSLFNSSKNNTDKPSFEEYKTIEKTNSDLKKFLDINRYSLCLLAKMNNNKMAFSKLKSNINLSHLNKKQQFLLSQNGFTIKCFKRLKNILDNLGINLTAFK